MSTWIRRPGRVELALAQASHDGGEACRRLCGASVVSSASCLRRVPPQCRRRCMKCAASSAAMTCMCKVACDEWAARVRQLVECGSRRATCHSNRPPRRMKGSNVRCPEASGGNSRARSCPTDSRETHGGHAAYAGQSEIDDPIARATNGWWKVSNSDAWARLSVYAGHRLGTGLHVH
eukprot:6183569-Pleurochrysis_carterae.AAC.1